MTITPAIAIVAAEQELNVRLHAAKHLRGIPKSQNQTAIDRLYDVLTDLHILKYEQEAVAC